MKRILTSLLTVATLVLSQTSFAAEWRPIAEITDFEKEIIERASRKSVEWTLNEAKGFTIGPDLIIIILMKDESIKYYGAKNDDAKSIENSNRANNTTTYVGDPQDEKTKKLEVQTLDSLIEVMRELQPNIYKGDYGGADIIFSHIVATIRSMDLSTMTDFHSQLQSKTYNLLGRLALLGGLEWGKRYGFQIIDLFSELIDKYPRAWLLKQNLLDFAIRNTILASRAPLKETPTVAERRVLTEKLLTIYTKDSPGNIHLGDERSVISVVAPDILEKIDNLNKTR